MKRIKYSKEPVLKVHNWIVTVGCRKGGLYRIKYFYCLHKKEVNALKAKAQKGAVVEVYRAHHNFIEAWQK